MIVLQRWSSEGSRLSHTDGASLYRQCYQRYPQTQDGHLTRQGMNICTLIN